MTSTLEKVVYYKTLLQASEQDCSELIDTMTDTIKVIHNKYYPKIEQSKKLIEYHKQQLLLAQDAYKKEYAIKPFRDPRHFCISSIEKEVEHDKTVTEFGNRMLLSELVEIIDCNLPIKNYDILELQGHRQMVQYLVYPSYPKDIEKSILMAVRFPDQFIFPKEILPLLKEKNVCTYQDLVQLYEEEVDSYYVQYEDNKICLIPGDANPYSHEGYIKDVLLSI